MSCQRWRKHPSIASSWCVTRGLQSVYAPGMLVMGFLAQLVSDWARGAQLRQYSVRFIKMIWPGDTVVCKGRVTDRFGDNGRYFAEIELWAENQKGELVLKGHSQVQGLYSLEDENRQRAGQTPIIMSVPRQSLIHPPPPPATEELNAHHHPHGSGGEHEEEAVKRARASQRVKPVAKKKH